MHELFMLSDNHFKIICYPGDKGKIANLLSSFPEQLKPDADIFKNQSGTIQIDISNEQPPEGLLTPTEFCFGIYPFEKFHEYLSLIGCDPTGIAFNDEKRWFEFYKVKVIECYDIPDLLYHYTKSESALAILETQCLWFSHRERFNDPFDTLMASHKVDEACLVSEAKKLTTAINESLSKQRFFCLTGGNKISSMWHHYSQAYSGVVLEFKQEELRKCTGKEIRPMRYAREPSVVLDNKKIKTLINLHEQKREDEFDTIMVSKYVLPLCTQKNICWEYEKEFRLSYVVKPGATDDDLKISRVRFNLTCISALIFGDKIDPIQERKIMDFVIDKKLDIKVFKLDSQKEQHCIYPKI